MHSRKDVIKYLVHSIDFWFERGEQYRRAMALVVMVPQRPFFVGSPGWVCGAPGFATSRRPREHQRMLGRIDIEADDVLHLGGKLRVVRQLETGGRGAFLGYDNHKIA